MPFRHCSIRYSMFPLRPCKSRAFVPRGNQATTSAQKTRRRKRALPPSFWCQVRSVRHLALLPVLVLVVLHNRGDGLEPVLLAVLHGILEIEVLDRDMVRPELEVAAHRLEIGLLGRAAHLVLLGEIA